jgi:orotidine-5'-phosphate decarboxylase
LVQDGVDEPRPLYEVVARRVQSWNEAGNCGLVVGATYPQELRSIRAICPSMPMLIPGVGVQGGDLVAAVQAGVDKHGERAILAVSRSILYAGNGPDFAALAGEEAKRLRDQMNEGRNNRSA